MFYRTFVLVVSLFIAPATYAELSVETFDDSNRYPESFTNYLWADDGTRIASVTTRGLALAECAFTDCVSAHSPPRIARARTFALEFNQRSRIEVQFDVPQQFVRVRVRYDRKLDPPQPVRASLIARGPLDPALPIIVWIDRADQHFNSDDGWQTLEVSATGLASITSIEIVGGRDVLDPNLNDNFIAIDDLEFDRTPLPPSDDAAPPQITINLINTDNMGKITGDFLEIGTNVTDQSELKIVYGVVTKAGTTIDSFGFCGTFSTPACPIAIPANFDGTAVANLSNEPDMGMYEAHVVACDILDNCDVETVEFSVAKTPPSHPVSPALIKGIEVSQGMQSLIYQTVPAPGDFRDYANSGVLVQGRNTLVRFYAYSPDDMMYQGYRARLSILITYADDQTKSFDIATNTGARTIELGPLSAADLATLRSSLLKTVNFVIPGSELIGAKEMQLWLRSESDADLTGRITVRFQDPIAIGINAVSLTIPGAPRAPNRTEIEGVIPYIRALLPVTDVDVVSFREALVVPFGGLDCDFIRTSTWFTVGTDTGLVRNYTNYSNITPVVGFVPSNVLEESTGGCAPETASADDDADRAGTVVAIAAGDTVAHEFSHRLGFRHAGSGHNEENSEMWPYPHGRVGPTDVGVFMTRNPRDTSNDPVPLLFGEWIVKVFDPANIDLHDYMSYGPKNVGITEGTAMQGNWISRLNWDRFWEAVALRRTPSSLAAVQTLSADSEPTVDALLVSGVVNQTNGGFNPVIRKRVPSELVSEPTGADATLELFGMDGALLQSNPVRLSTMADVSDSETPRLFAIVPYVEGVGQLRLSDGERVLLEKSASPHPPHVKVLTPNGGEQFTSGIVEVAWEADDADGDPLTFLVQYSPDGGKSWLSVVSIPPGNPFKTSFGVGEFAASANAVIRVLASDGIRLAEDLSDCPFSLRAGEPEDCSVVVDVRPGSCPNPLQPGSPGVIPVAILGSERVNVSGISSLALEGVPATRTSLKDVTSAGACDQATIDGVTDLVAQFDSRAVSEALSNRLGRALELGEVLEVTLTGQMATGGSTSASILGTDTVTIVPPGQ